MSHLSKLKITVGYETNVPRCGICTHFRKSRIVLTKNSNTVKTHHHCAKHHFNVTPNSICDTWKSEVGEMLEKNT